MNKRPNPGESRSGTFKQIDVGKAVVISDAFITENHSLRHAEAIVEKTMQNAESAALHYIEEAKAKAQAILEEAKVEAARIIAEEGEAERDAILKKGYEEGFEAGMEKGLEEAVVHCQNQIQAANVLIQTAYQAQTRVIQSCQEDMLALMHNIMSMVLAHELHFRPEYLAQIIHQATTQIESNGQARIIVHPDTLRVFKEAMKEHYPNFCKAHHLSFTADSACPPNEVYLETVEANYNISPDEQAQNYLKNVAPLLEIPQATVEGLTQSTEPAPSLGTMVREATDD